MAYTKNALPSGSTITKAALDNMENGIAAASSAGDSLNTALAAKAPIASPTFTGTVSGVTAAMVGLSNVDNTSDVNKPVSTSVSAALASKAPIASPTFTGTPSAPTPTTTDSSTRLATTAWVKGLGYSTGGTGGGTTAPATANDTLYVNAAAHGLTPSTTDIGPVLNTLIGTLNANGGGVIAFPPGNYNVGTTIQLQGGVYLVSSAPNHGYIAASPSSQSVKFSQASGMTGWMIDSNGGWSMGIQGIDLSGNGNATSGGIRFRGVYWGAIKQSMANGFGLGGFRQESPSGGGSAGFACVYEDLMTTNCVDSGVTAYTGAIDIDGTDHYISRCEFACRSLSSGITTSNKYVVACLIRGSNHFVDTVVAETSDKGFYITGTRSRFVNLRADTNNGDGFHVVGGSNDFSNCDSIGNSQAATNTHDGWIIENGAWGCVFSNCTVRLAGSIKVRYGFYEQTNVSTPVYAPQFVNCLVEDAGNQRWYQPNGSYAGVAFSGIQKPSQSTTPDVSQSLLVDTSNFTSAMTVTNFVGGVEGQTIRLIGNTNITITNGTSIKTSTGANVTLSANRTYAFTYFRGVWYGA